MHMLARIWLRIPQTVSWRPNHNIPPFQRRHLSTMGAMGQHKVHTTDRLEHLRALMRKEDVNVQAYVVPSEDQRTFTFHFLVEFIKNFFVLDSSEYLASCDQRRAFISGFNGSAGTCIWTPYFSSVLVFNGLFQVAQSLQVHRWSLLSPSGEPVG